MSKWISTHVTTLVFSALTLTIALLIPILSHAAQATLTWDSNDPAPDGYLIYHRTEGQPYDYSQPIWTGYDNTGTVNGLEENTTYYFVVRAFVATHESADSNEVKFINGTSSDILIEAEDGDLQWPMQIGDDVAASTSGYVWVPTGQGDVLSPSENAGYAEYHFEIQKAGDYIISGRQISNKPGSESFFVSIDGQPDMVWYTRLSSGGVWTWDVISDRSYSDTRDNSNPKVYHMEAGVHTLKIRQREDGTKLDTIVITNDINVTPAGGTHCLADINRDKVVGTADLAILAAAFGSNPSYPNWNPAADCDADGVVGTSDLAILACEFGRTDCPIP